MVDESYKKLFYTYKKLQGSQTGDAWVSDNARFYTYKKLQGSQTLSLINH